MIRWTQKTDTSRGIFYLHYSNRAFENNYAFFILFE